MTAFKDAWEKFTSANGNFGEAINDLKAIAGDNKSNDQAEAQYKLGYIHYAPRRVERSYSEALKWYSLAAELGHVGAIFYLGEIHESAKGGLIPNPFKAFIYYSIAVEMGCIIVRTVGSKIIEDEQIAVDAKNRAGLALSDAQKAEAEVKVREWLDAHPPK